MKPAAVAIALLALLTVWGASALGAGAPPTVDPPSAASANTLAFVRGTETAAVWSARIDGSGAHQLGPGQEPIVAPSGEYIAAAESGSHGPALTVYGTGYTQTHSYFDIAKVTATPLAWSPDSRYLAVELLSTSIHGDHGSGLAIVDTQTQTTATIAKGVIYGASFDPGGSERLVYGLSPSLTALAHTAIYMANPAGDLVGPDELTTGLNPVWGSRGIVYDRQTQRGKDRFPAFQLWLTNGLGGAGRQLTHTRVNGLAEGLVPLQFSANGNHLLAEFEGQDQSYAYAVTLSPRRSREVQAGRSIVQGGSISSDGTTLLIDAGGFEQPPSHGKVERIPFGGGPATVLSSGAQPSWNG